MPEPSACRLPGGQYRMPGREIGRSGAAGRTRYTPCQHETAPPDRSVSVVPVGDWMLLLSEPGANGHGRRSSTCSDLVQGASHRGAKVPSSTTSDPGGTAIIGVPFRREAGTC